MSQLAVYLSRDPAPAQWGDSALVSFDAERIFIHLHKDDSLRTIRKAARLLDSVTGRDLLLSGKWQADQQWAFATSFGSVRKPAKIEWCQDEHAAHLQKMYEALVFTRNLINETPQNLSPELLAARVTSWLKELGGDAISATRIVGEDLVKAGWMGIWEVGRGSDRPPVFLEVDYNPSGLSTAPVAAALVGKGITFDSGGYSIKASEGMLTMKCDMGGAATVAGALGLAISQGLNKRVKLFLCCAENLISGHAYKLGDIITYKNGTTVEVVNTDAEGRLVLADGLLAAGETGAHIIIDAATLTGAAMTAVGSDFHALFALDKDYQTHAIAVANEELEPVWPLPLEKWHQEACPSPYADTANSRAVKGGGAGGASNAAGFLSRFVPRDGAGWLHFDLAAAFNNSATNLYPAGATGLGIRTIARLLHEAE